MRIRKPRHITTFQLIVVAAVGIIGGVYIYQPLFRKFLREEEPKTTVQKE